MTQDFQFLQPGTFRAFAHRGFALDGAENTGRAFADALKLGATHFETDARSTADGVALAFHDATLERVTDAHGDVHERTFAQLRGVRVLGDEPLLPMETLLGDYPDVGINIDVKDARSVEPVARAIAKTNSVDRVCLAGFSAPVLMRAVRAVESATGKKPLHSTPTLNVAAFVLSCLAIPNDGLLRKTIAGAACMQIPRHGYGFEVVNSRNVAAAHRAGAEVHVWVIDTKPEMHELIEMHVDGIVTNRMDLLRQVLTERDAQETR